LGILAADMIHFSCGFSSGFTSPALAHLKAEFKLSDSESVWFGKGATR
jgi:hypothetical protein